jgi:hypothetical protein
MAMFDRQGIPEHLLYDGRSRLQFVDAVALLTSSSLVRVQTRKQSEQQLEEQSFEMHSLLQLPTRKWLELHKQVEKWQKVSLRIMTAAFRAVDMRRGQIVKYSFRTRGRYLATLRRAKKSY